MAVTEEGIDREAKEAQSAKAEMRMVCTVGGIVRVWSAAQPENILYSISVAPVGMFTEVREEQPKKTDIP